MTRRLSLQSVDSGCKKIVKNRSAEEVEINSKKQKRMDWPFFFFPKRREAFFRKLGCHFRHRVQSGMSHGITHVPTVRNVLCLNTVIPGISCCIYTFFLFLSKLLHWKKYIFYVSEMTICFCSLHPKPPPPLFLLNCICVFHCRRFRHCLCTRKLRLTVKCIAYYHFSTFFRGKVVRNVKHEINDVLK